MFAGSYRAVAGVLAAVLAAAVVSGCRHPKPLHTPPQASAPLADSTAYVEMDDLPDKPGDPPPAREAADNMAEGLLVWDAVFKEYRAQPGETNAPFSFSLTNVTSEPITIYTTETTCDCTVAQLPSIPWRIPPGGTGELRADIDLRDKRGAATNYLVVLTSKGNRLLSLKTIIPRPQANVTQSGVPPARP